MKVRIDGERCQGHNRCIAIAPDIFQWDDLGYGVVTTEELGADEQEQAARRAAANCPESAIEIIEQRGQEVQR
jgi:ferredoxin